MCCALLAFVSNFLFFPRPLLFILSVEFREKKRNVDKVCYKKLQIEEKKSFFLKSSRRKGFAQLLKCPRMRKNINKKKTIKNEKEVTEKPEENGESLD